MDNHNPKEFTKYFGKCFEGKEFCVGITKKGFFSGSYPEIDGRKIRAFAGLEAKLMDECGLNSYYGEDFQSGFLKLIGYDGDVSPSDFLLSKSVEPQEGYNLLFVVDSSDGESHKRVLLTKPILKIYDLQRHEDQFKDISYVVGKDDGWYVLLGGIGLPLYPNAKMNSVAKSLLQAILHQEFEFIESSKTNYPILRTEGLNEGIQLAEKCISLYNRFKDKIISLLSHRIIIDSPLYDEESLLKNYRQELGLD